MQGVGQTTGKAILDAFPSLVLVSLASVEDLMQGNRVMWKGERRSKDWKNDKSGDLSQGINFRASC